VANNSNTDNKLLTDKNVRISSSDERRFAHFDGAG